MFADFWKGERLPAGEVSKLLAEKNLSAVTEGRSRGSGDQEYEDKYPYLHALRYINSRMKSK
jgi:hypothetical protein